METTAWGPDADYKTQVDYRYQMPLLMTSHYPLGPGVLLHLEKLSRVFAPSRFYMIVMTVSEGTCTPQDVSDGRTTGYGESDLMHVRSG